MALLPSPAARSEHLFGFGETAAKQAFGCKIGLDCTAHRADSAVIGHQLLELLAGVPAAAIGVMQQRVGLTAAPDCHHQRVDQEPCRPRCTHRPARDTAGEQIDDGSHIEPTFRCLDISEVSWSVQGVLT